MKINGNLYAMASLTVPYPIFPGVAKKKKAQVPKVSSVLTALDKISII